MAQHAVHSWLFTEYEAANGFSLRTWFELLCLTKKSVSLYSAVDFPLLKYCVQKFSAAGGFSSQLFPSAAKEAVSMLLSWLMSQVTAFHLAKAPKRECRESELHP